MLKNELQFKEYLVNGNKFCIYFKKILGDVLKAEREKQGLTIKDVGNQARLFYNDIERIEKGNHRINYLLTAELLKFYRKRLIITLVDDD